MNYNKNKNNLYILKKEPDIFDTIGDTIPGILLDLAKEYKSIAKEYSRKLLKFPKKSNLNNYKSVSKEYNTEILKFPQKNDSKLEDKFGEFDIELKTFKKKCDDLYAKTYDFLKELKIKQSIQKERDNL